jgi:hypothetical protein
MGYLKKRWTVGHKTFQLLTTLNALLPPALSSLSTLAEPICEFRCFVRLLTLASTSFRTRIVA